MSIKSNIKKLLIISVWMIASTGVLVLLVAAIRKKNSKTCKRYKIEINGGKPSLYIDQKQILNLLTINGSEKIAGKTIPSFDLNKLETQIRKNAWIREARLFIDNNDILRVIIYERDPVARIFTTSGNSFYIDSSGIELPLSDKGPLKLPVFTSFPEGKRAFNEADSIFLCQIRRMSWYISQDPFWRAEISQININLDKTFEMVPVVGNHLIEFGDGNDFEQKFHRLFVFYTEVMAKTGFDRYSKVNVQYAGQVIGTKKGFGTTRIDSVQAAKNIEKLIRLAQQLQVDTIHQQNINPLEHNTVTEQSLTNYDLVPEKDN